jgi:hypothetical protein
MWTSAVMIVALYGVDRKIKSPFASVGAGASAPLAGRHGTLDAMRED